MRAALVAPRRPRAALVIALAALWAAQAQAGLFDDDEARRQIADLKIQTETRFDQQSRAQLDLAGQIQRQAGEIAQLRGQIETLTHEIETAKKRQQDFYLDLDTRLRKFESAGTAGGGGVAPAAAVNPENAANPAVPGAAVQAPTAGDPAREAEIYDAAMAQFKAGKYKEAVAGFTAFLQKYPDGKLAPNAQYWLGNAWYAQHDCKRTLDAQVVVANKYPDSAQAPEAWLMIAACQQEMGNAAATRRSLETVIAKYPASPAAKTAQQRLKKK